MRRPTKRKLLDVEGQVESESPETKDRGNVYPIHLLARTVAIIVIAGILLFMASHQFFSQTWTHTQLRQSPTKTTGKQCREQKRPVVYDSKAQAAGRKSRFPNVEERIRVYMSNWYTPPCDDFHDGFVHYEYYKNNTDPLSSFYTIDEVASFNTSPKQRSFHIDSSIKPALMFYATRYFLDICAKTLTPLRFYCTDGNETILHTMQQLGWSEQFEVRVGTPPLLLQFGDAKETHAVESISELPVSSYPRVPHIKKFRRAIGEKELKSFNAEECIRTLRPGFQDHDPYSLLPIVWKLNTKRHYGDLSKTACLDIPWSSKQNSSVFRGKLNGAAIFDPISNEEKCLQMPRCRLVYTHVNSTLVDAFLTDMMHKLPSKIADVQLMTSIFSIHDLLRYKGLVMLEGNDVSSGLKWALLSNSVVLMPRPTFTSWAMEELLEPWVHYVPLDEGLTDVEDKMQWIVENDAEAQQISKRASLWIKDLVYHTDSMKDDQLVFKGILERYRQHFRKRPTT